VEQIPPAFTSAPLAFGSSIHEAVAAFYQAYLEGDFLRPDQMLDVYRDVWRQKEDIHFFNGDDEISLLLRAEQLLNLFHESFEPSTTVLGVEEFFAINIGDLPPFQGYIDLIEKSLAGQISVVDLKTASKKPSNGNIQSNLQLTAYSLGASGLGFDPEDLNLRLDVLVKTTKPDLVRYETTRTEEDRQRFIKLVQQVWKGIEAGVWFPKQDWQCQQCAFAAPCADW
jgi:putative RecB family exonuclease